ncbi:MAG TPA: mannose-1-phosphate guanylyltransferase, partial [Deinococcales bacterium]|nr:mannose-1-phosphate guanylyltransferase [Deinococcales bacterium]
MTETTEGTAGAVPFVPVILAGGSGERFWPLSRRSRPKQFLALDGTDRSLIQATADRLAPLSGGMDNLLIVAGHAHRGLILEHLPDLPIENLVVEPVGRDTAPAVLLAALNVVRRSGPDTVMGVFPSDHRIGNPIAFQEVVSAGIATVSAKGGIVTIGVRPSYPATGYGYLEAGEVLERVNAHEVRRVARFVEKPTLEVAERFVATGRYFWNAGMFIFRAGEIIDEFRRHAP